MRTARLSSNSPEVDGTAYPPAGPACPAVLAVVLLTAAPALAGPGGGSWTDLVRHAGQLSDAGDLTGALQVYRRAVSAEDAARAPAADLALTWNNIGSLAHELALWREAIGAYRRAIDIVERNFGPADERLVGYVLNLATVHMDRARFADADRTVARAAAIIAQRPSLDSRSRSRSLTIRAGVLAVRGKHREAEALLQEALAIARSSPDGLRETAAALNNLGVTLGLRGDFAGARKYVQRAIDLVETASGREHPELIRPLLNLADSASGQHRYDDAVATIERAMAIAAREPGMSSGLRADLLRRYAVVLRKAGRKEEAKRASAHADSAGRIPGEYTVDIYTLSARPNR